MHPRYDLAFFQEIARWGAKIVRVSIHPSAWREFGPETSLTQIEQAVEWSRQAGMYSIIAFHSIGFPPYDQYQPNPYDIYNTSIPEIKDFWAAVSERFRDNKSVLAYELFNEPVNLVKPTAEEVMKQDWILWIELAHELTDLIRTNDPDSIVIVGGLDWAYDLHLVLEMPVERENIVYATHPYPDKNWNRGWDDAFGKVADKYPVFNTEFGFTLIGHKAEYKYLGKGRYRDEITSFMEDHYISWTVWCFSPDWGPRLICDKNYTPTISGRFFREKLLELNYGL